MRTKEVSPIQNKITFLSFILIGTLCIITVRLAYLQIHLFSQYLTQSTNNFIRHRSVSPPRGNIVDCNNKLLVTNRPVINLYWQGTIKKITHEETLDILEKLEPILEQPLRTNNHLVSSIKRANQYGNSQLIMHDLSFEQLSKIKEQFSYHNNLLIETDFERLYPYNSYASHILGYLGRIHIDSIGKMGLEELFEENLKGQPGLIQTTINSIGTPLSHTELSRALSGTTIRTTIDLSLQHIAETIFPVENTGTVIIMNPINGALKAIVSRPNFDPNIFIHPLSTDTWKQLQANQPFLNRAFKACYPPGSIFKLITTSAALELNMMTTATTTYCKGYSTFAKRQYWCNQRRGHGTLNIEQALAESCNIPFFEIAKRIDIDLLAHYAHKFGLGEKTNIILSESSGIVPSHAWKKQHKGEPWWPGETLSVAIGQSFLNVTPIQIARMISGIFTGYLIKPRILIDEPIVTQPLDILPSTLSFLRETMRAVVEQGTGKRVHNKNFTVYGKTSTAQVSDLSKRHQGVEHMEHGWFVGYIQYHDYTPLTIVILLENVGSSRAATKVAKNFLIEYRKLLNQQSEVYYNSNI